MPADSTQQQFRLATFRGRLSGARGEHGSGTQKPQLEGLRGSTGQPHRTTRLSSGRRNGETVQPSRCSSVTTIKSVFAPRSSLTGSEADARTSPGCFLKAYKILVVSALSVRSTPGFTDRHQPLPRPTCARRNVRKEDAPVAPITLSEDIADRPGCRWTLGSKS